MQSVNAADDPSHSQEKLMTYRMLLAGVGVFAFIVGGVKLFLNARSSQSTGDSVTPSVLTRINAEYNDTRH